MSDIFLSYASEDVTRASLLARALMRQGWSVWWDRSILPGKVFDTVIEAELSAAKCVLVLWSQPSVESRWVRAEAGEALDKGHLIPVLLDEVVIPLVFRQVQAASLIGWDGDDTHAGFQSLLKAITAHVPPQPLPTGRQPAADVGGRGAADTGDGATQGGAGASTDRTDTGRKLGLWVVVAACGLAVAGGAVYMLRDDQSTAALPVAKDQRTDTSQQAIPVGPATQPEPPHQPEDGPEYAVVAPKPAQTPVRQPEAVPETPRPAAPAPTPVPPKPAPVVVKPATESPVVRPAPAPAPDTVAKVAPAETASKPAGTPLTILAVVWAMPNDNGVASTARIKEYSSELSRMMTAVVDEALDGPARFEYYYPDQQEHYRLLKDSNPYAASKSLCDTRRADLVISGFVKGAEFVSSSFGYALTRNPVFSVYDCKANKKITQTYQVAEHVDDDFPFEKSTTMAFRKFVTRDAALAKR